MALIKKKSWGEGFLVQKCALRTTFHSVCSEGNAARSAIIKAKAQLGFAGGERLSNNFRWLLCVREPYFRFHWWRAKDRVYCSPICIAYEFLVSRMEAHEELREGFCPTLGNLPSGVPSALKGLKRSVCPTVTNVAFLLSWILRSSWHHVPPRTCSDIIRLFGECNPLFKLIYNVVFLYGSKKCPWACTNPCLCCGFTVCIITENRPINF